MFQGKCPIQLTKLSRPYTLRQKYPGDISPIRFNFSIPGTDKLYDRTTQFLPQILLVLANPGTNNSYNIIRQYMSTLDIKLRKIRGLIETS